MISVEGVLYGLRRIRHKARKYRRFGGVRIILGWHTMNNRKFKAAAFGNFRMPRLCVC